MLDFLILGKLVDRLIDLVKTRKEINRALFLDLIQPAFQALEAVHTDYIDSLMRYNSRLADTKVPMDLNHPVFDEIDLDSLKSGHLRTKLKDFRPKDSSPKLTKFLTAIDFYLRGLWAWGDHAKLVEKIVGDARVALDFEDLKGLTLVKGSIDVFWDEDGTLKGTPMMITSDPMRFALRQVLVGFDAPKPTSEEEDLAQLAGDVNEALWFRTNEERRTLCSYAIKEAMGRVQDSYALVSAEFSTLRAELMI
jgi:hypothetical protein